jgi:glutathione peroxidase
MTFPKRTLGIFVMSTLGFAASFHDFTLHSIDGRPAPLKDYKGKVVLAVNVASQCGYTPQYAGLESLYRKYKDRGLVVLGFPSNDFGSQEPGTNEEIKTFCTRKYNVTFPMFSKINVKGDGKESLYKFLTEATGGKEVAWNFTKFLVDRNGNVMKRFESRVTPESEELVSAIEKALE